MGLQDRQALPTAVVMLGQAETQVPCRRYPEFGKQEVHEVVLPEQASQGTLHDWHTMLVLLVKLPAGQVGTQDTL